ncbi:hypothetical protein CSH63_27280 [Micromonospora tulbaghiae]|uniref:Uncharacterized protein n=1 Tax=Micromonospora tulbaghiae TaxID=479978 RepID=A0A386WRN5_9ACTN|nr:hypothetical protein [Micromonospora tulbaghiae]AYF31075.1 hypothetical protein CSH63_27280 [Micromonospora tulbaghiae]
MTAPAARVPSPPSVSMLSLVRQRMAGSGWQHRRDPLNGREEWMEAALPPEQREPRAVRVDELFRGASGWVVEGCNGNERLLLRCVPGSDPRVVLATLELRRMLPDPALTGRQQSATAASRHGRALVAGVACVCGDTFDGDGRDPETAMTLLDHHIAASRSTTRAEAVIGGA